MHLQYVTDTKGNATAVLIPIREWKTIEKKISKSKPPEDSEEPTKEEILESVRHGLQQVKLHMEGKIKLQSAKDFLNEL